MVFVLELNKKLAREKNYFNEVMDDSVQSQRVPLYQALPKAASEPHRVDPEKSCIRYEVPRFMISVRRIKLCRLLFVIYWKATANITRCNRSRGTVRLH